MSAFGKIGYILAKNAPKILFWGGMAAGTAGTVWACVSAVKLKDDITTFKAKMINVEVKEEAGDILPKEAARERNQIRAKFALLMLRRGGPPLLLLGASGGALMAAHGILNNRLVGTASALGTTAATLEAVGERIRAKYGDDAYDEIMNGTVTQTFIETTTKEDGTVVKKEVTAPVVLNIGSPYVQFFDKAHSLAATGDIATDMACLNIQQHFLNNRLRTVGRIVKAEVDELLGFPVDLKESPDSLIIGCVFEKDNPRGDNYFDFRAEAVYVEDPETGIRHPTIKIDPNYDGDIYHPYKK